MTVALLDDEPLILMALQNELGKFYDIQFAVTNYTDFFLRLAEKQPDLVLLDVMLPGDKSGVEVARIVRQRYPEIKILMLSIDNRRETFRQLLDIGMDGFVSKNAPSTEIIHAVDVIIRGEKYYGKDVTQLIREIRVALLSGIEPQLTQVEVDILYACCQGKNAAKIGEQLHLSPRTVEAHKNTLFVKLGVNSTTELIITALKQGIIHL